MSTAETTPTPNASIEGQGAVAPKADATPPAPPANTASPADVVTFEQRLEDWRKEYPRQWERHVVRGDLASPRLAVICCDERVSECYGYDPAGSYVIRPTPLMELEVRAFASERVAPEAALAILGDHIRGTGFYRAIEQGLPTFVVGHWPEFKMGKSFKDTRLLTVNAEVLSAVLTGRVQRTRTHKEDRRSIFAIRRRVMDAKGVRDGIAVLLFGQFDSQEPGENYNSRTDRIIIYIGQGDFLPGDLLNAVLHYPQSGPDGKVIEGSSLVERLDRRMIEDSARYSKMRVKPVATTKGEFDAPAAPQLDDAQPVVNDELRPVERSGGDKPRIIVNTQSALAWRRCGNKDYRESEAAKKGKCPAHGKLVLGVDKGCAVCRATMVRTSKVVTDADKASLQVQQPSPSP